MNTVSIMKNSKIECSHRALTQAENGLKGPALHQMKALLLCKKSTKKQRWRHCTCKMNDCPREGQEQNSSKKKQKRDEKTTPMAVKRWKQPSRNEENDHWVEKGVPLAWIIGVEVERE
jgi:hypothetical protein